MNGEPLPMLNGFPVRLIVPGKFGVYWTKHLAWIRALTREDANYWMATAYRIPDTPRGNTTPGGRGRRCAQDGSHRTRAHAGAVVHRRA